MVPKMDREDEAVVADMERSWSKIFTRSKGAVADLVRMPAAPPAKSSLTALNWGFSDIVQVGEGI